LNLHEENTITLPISCRGRACPTLPAADSAAMRGRQAVPLQILPVSRDF
jgi:hypothetical protein